jgi:threonine/homoserine/homoserine lactone efflux protein
MILSKSARLETGEGASGEAKTDAAVLRQGFLTAFLNPKGLLVFFSLVPQFVSPSAAFPVAVQLLVLGLVHTFNCLVIYGAVGLSAGSLGELLKRRLRFARMIRWLSGSVLIALGLRMAFPGQR